jgi:hypothetical protein
LVPCDSVGAVASSHSWFNRLRRHLKALLATVTCLILTAPVRGSNITLEVPAFANIFAAGSTSAFSGGLPVLVPVSGSAKYFQFSSSGTITPDSGQNNWHAEGHAGDVNINSYGGISGYVGDFGLPLVGVFLSDDTPSEPAPAAIDFSAISVGRNFLTISPSLRQVFFIGDGRTDGHFVQTFIAPPGATRLYLGFADAQDFRGDPGEYSDNKGSLRVAVAAAKRVRFRMDLKPVWPVPATANIFAAGSATPFAGEVPVWIPIGHGKTDFQFRSSGHVSPFYDFYNLGPEGVIGQPVTINSYGGISAFLCDHGFPLVGVFLSDAAPDGPAPSTLDFSGNGRNFTSLSPGLGQVFYIGNGRTDGGVAQTFHAPAGATRLFLGFPDAVDFQGDPGSYFDNVGRLKVLPIIVRHSNLPRDQ